MQAVKAATLFNMQFNVSIHYCCYYYNYIVCFLFKRFSRVTVRSLVYLSESWAVPASELWVGGALGMIQEVPFPASGRVTTYNSSIFNETGLRTEDFELRNILSTYNKRDGKKIGVGGEGMGPNLVVVVVVVILFLFFCGVSESSYQCQA